MNDIAWRAIGRLELAELLKDAQQVSAEAVGATTVYRLDHDGRELLAISLVDGHALLVEAERPAVACRRRRADQET